MSQSGDEITDRLSGIRYAPCARNPVIGTTLTRPREWPPPSSVELTNLRCENWGTEMQGSPLNLKDATLTREGP
jgi:hypothetical protein